MLADEKCFYHKNCWFSTLHISGYLHYQRERDPNLPGVFNYEDSG